MRNFDTSTGKRTAPPIPVLFVSIAVTLPLIILVLYVPAISSDVNCRASPFPMYSELLQAIIELVKFDEPLIVQVNVTSFLMQASLSSGREVINS